MYKVYLNHKPGFITVKSNNGSDTNYSLEDYTLDYNRDNGSFHIKKNSSSKNILTYRGNFLIKDCSHGEYENLNLITIKVPDTEDTEMTFNINQVSYLTKLGERYMLKFNNGDVIYITEEDYNYISSKL